MFKEIFSMSNAKKAAPVAIAVYLAQSFTATKSKTVQGAAMVLAALVTLPLASKI
jgi:hypothetical protein